MRIFVMGAGRMGAWLVEELCLDHEVAVYDRDPRKLKYFFRVERYTDVGEVRAFEPRILINAVSLPETLEAFDAALPHLPEDCILSDIASVKTGLRDYYAASRRRFVSTHPMFGPTFANIRDLSSQHTVIIKESDEEGKAFFKDFYSGLRLNLHEYTFEEHDRTIAYSLSVPFASSLVFAACMKKQDAPGTTFNEHLKIAKALLSEDDRLLAEILFNPYTVEQIERINSRLRYLTHIIKGRDMEEMEKFLERLRRNIRQEGERA
ncbi:MAG: prephenate dehydrogenase [Deltaproteobacteria bacterium]|nr:prephenate dehydrogenase [Deltaproteobacteria bacterium]MBW1922033.1 prephenate dehydrogenase [Deltaproteobacteria bacterium]MBW1949870.1 prephenate dehydrogenase [Deltaproteobacteria bacterium]MBW2008435.1 prephenate dehydrogenase [Deltaproteobacteria bacterium]MBW2103475.1 prephenate dehydrogenase [Deltaproteobacteria bacterium]